MALNMAARISKSQKTKTKKTQTQTYPDKPALEHASPNQSPPKNSNSNCKYYSIETRNDWRTDVAR